MGLSLQNNCKYRSNRDLTLKLNILVILVEKTDFAVNMESIQTLFTFRKFTALSITKEMLHKNIGVKQSQPFTVVVQIVF